MCACVCITRVYAPTNTVSARPKIDSIDFQNDTADPNITAEIFGEVGWEKKFLRIREANNKTNESYLLLLQEIYIYISLYIFSIYFFLEVKTNA